MLRPRDFDAAHRPKKFKTQVIKAMKRAILIATGYRAELEPLVQHRPTPLIKIVDKPILVHIIEFLAKQGIKQFDLILNHLPQQIELLLNDGTRWGIKTTFHLARNSKYPFIPLKPTLETWGSETIVLGQADCLPKFFKHPFSVQEESPLLFHYPSREWTGWGLFPANLFNEIPADTTLEELPAKIKAPYISTKAIPFLSTHNFHEIIQSNIRFLKETSHTGLYPSGAHMVEPGIWISRAVSIHPGIVINPPIFIGENCQIKADVHLGPNAIIENNCVIDKGSNIQNSIICQKSYVGEELNIDNSIIDRNLIINLSHQSLLYIHDDFILSELSPPHLMDYPLKWLERLFAFLLIIVLFPFYLTMKISCTLVARQVLELPAEGRWKTFDWMQFFPKDGQPPNRFQSIFLRLPVLFHILSGKAHFVGVRPRTKEETEQLPPDWQKLYLKCKVGLISLDRLDFESTVNPDDIYASEAYYAVHMGLGFDIILLMRWFKKNFFRGSGRS